VDTSPRLISRAKAPSRQVASLGKTPTARAHGQQVQLCQRWRALLLMNETSTTRVVPEREAVKTALRSIGLSSRQVRALLEHGWRGLVSEAEAEAAELKDQLDALRSSLSGERVP